MTQAPVGSGQGTPDVRSALRVINVADPLLTERGNSSHENDDHPSFLAICCCNGSYNYGL